MKASWNYNGNMHYCRYTWTLFDCKTLQEDSGNVNVRGSEILMEDGMVICTLVLEKIMIIKRSKNGQEVMVVILLSRNV